MMPPLGFGEKVDGVADLFQSPEIDKVGDEVNDKVANFLSWDRLYCCNRSSADPVYVFDESDEFSELAQGRSSFYPHCRVCGFRRECGRSARTSAAQPARS